MRGLPSDLRLRLLDHNPMPSLAEMLSFVQRFRAVRQSDVESVGHPNSDHLASSIADLTTAVAALMADQ